MAVANPPDLRSIAQALGGEVHGRQVLAPGPGHSRQDRSLSVRPSDVSPGGFVVHSHAGDDWRLCRDHVATALGLAPIWRQREADPTEVARRQEARRRAETAERQEAERLRKRAGAMWREAQCPVGTLVERYLNSRALELPRDVAGTVLRFHPACPWGQGTAPAMMAEIRCVHTGEFLGVHRTALTADGRKLGRKVFGSAAGGGVMLDPLAAARPTLVVGEGIETCLAGRQVGLRPMWSLISVGNIGTLPVLDDVIRLTVLAEVDTAPNRPSAAACEKVGARWHAADRSVDFLFPPDGAKDFNDALMMQRGAA